jgi:hypothetical protein
MLIELALERFIFVLLGVVSSIPIDVGCSFCIAGVAVCSWRGCSRVPRCSRIRRILTI